MSEHFLDRREFLLRSATIVAGTSFAPALRAAAGDGAGDDARRPRDGGRGGPGLVDTSASPHVVLRSIGLGDVGWTDGFWGDRFETCRDVMVPNLWRVMGGTEPSQFYH